MVLRKSVGDGFKTEPGEGCKTGLDVGVEEEATVDEVGVEEGDVEAGEAEELR